MTNVIPDFSYDSFASVPAVKQYLQAAEACGLDCAPMLEAANIHPETLSDNNKRISIKAMERLLALLIEASNDPCFGLHSARFVEPASYSVLGYISMNSSTLRENLANIAIFEKIVGDMGVSSTQIADGFALQRWDCRFTDPEVRRHAIENVLGSWQIFTRQFAHIDTLNTDCVWFEHPAPADPQCLNDYQEIFGCDVHFDQAASGIRFGEEFLDSPLPQADKRLLKTLLDHATQILIEIDRDQSITLRVKNLLRLMLKEGEPSSTQVAEVLNMSSRTLQRKLGAEDTQYQTVLNQVRLELALYYLENTTLSVDQIAHELAYAETRSFHRSFKQWTGRTAGSYRSERA